MSQYNRKEGQSSAANTPKTEDNGLVFHEEPKAGNTEEQKTLEEEDAEDHSGNEREDGEIEPSGSTPDLPTGEAPPPLPNEPVPGQAEDDGWDAMWDDGAQAYYFYNRLTGVSQWENPRVPDAAQGPPGVNSGKDGAKQAQLHLQQQHSPPSSPPRPAGGYDPAIHGDYDPDAWYAQPKTNESSAPASGSDPNVLYTATGAFNRFTGRWQPVGLTPENFNDESKSHRQLNAYFDVEAAANSHGGKSLKAERSGKKLTKKELKAFKEKRREKKEEKRRAWLRD